MRDFPPEHTAYPDQVGGLAHAGSRHGGSRHAGPRHEPDTRSPIAFLWWLMRDQASLLLLATLLATVWNLPMIATPWLLGQTIDYGIIPGDASATAWWLIAVGAATVLGSSTGVWYHTTVVRSWVVALYSTVTLITYKSTQLGHVLTRRVPTGEVLSIAGSDANEFGALMEITSRALASLVAFVAVAGIMFSMSPQLGTVAVLAAPALLALALPMLVPLHTRQAQQRRRDSELTSRATDIVAGLRILRGIGGERTFGANYAAQSERVRVAGVQAGLWMAIVEAAGVIFTGAFLILMMWLAVRDVPERLSVGDLVAFLGYGLFLISPVRTFFEFAQKATRARVSAAKAIAVLSQEPAWPTRGPRQEHVDESSPRLNLDGALCDEVSGLVAPAGSLTVVVSTTPDASAALADRLGRYLPGDDAQPPSLEADEEATGHAARAQLAHRAAERAHRLAQDRQRARQTWGVSLGGTDLSCPALDHVREVIVVSGTEEHVFGGSLQQAIDPHGRLSRRQAEQAIHVAAAEDVFEAVQHGWASVLEERGRGLSGGQRQRVVLARAVAADPAILVLVEPTSAVDAHTEARIAERLRTARAGRTTVVMTGSPLLANNADQVALLVGGRVSACNTHEELLRSSASYREVMVRAEAVDIPAIDTGLADTARNATGAKR